MTKQGGRVSGMGRGNVAVTPMCMYVVYIYLRIYTRIYVYI